eukprot:113185-Pyramimonas_sp.AAC.1
MHSTPQIHIAVMYTIRSQLNGTFGGFSEMLYGTYANCSEHILVERVRVNLGLGMSIGSVPPRLNGNCVRNVTFRHVEFHSPIKAIYIKTNPGDVGSGIVEVRGCRNGCRSREERVRGSPRPGVRVPLSGRAGVHAR